MRTALQNLQGLRDEGFVTAAEFSSRKKAIIDGATALPAGSKPTTAAKSGAGKVAGKAAAGTAGTKKSVFDRLGAASNVRPPQCRLARLHVAHRTLRRALRTLQAIPFHFSSAARLEPRV